MIINEKDIRFDFSSAVSAKRFDDGKKHGLTHAMMKSVDFIVEEEDRIIFVEVKDFQHPSSQPKELKKNLNKLSSESLVNHELMPKCRDSFLYEYAMNNLGKPVYYYVLIALNTLSESNLTNQTNLLWKRIPVYGLKGNPWKNKFIHGCMIMNIETWNTYLSQYPVSRISQQTA